MRQVIMVAGSAHSWLQRNWVVPLFAVAILVELAFARSTDWAADGLAETVILFDLCVFLPAMHAICYRKSLSPKALILRTIGLACFGIFLASKLVPAGAQTVLRDLLWVKSAGWLGLALVELWLALQIIRLVYGGKHGAAEISRLHGTPEWVARLMLLEARFWKTVWKLLRRR
jgi:hypothetical protein